MNYNDFVGERIVQDHKAASQASADRYLLHHMPQSIRRPTVTMRLLASLGAVLVTYGVWLQARCESMTATAVEPKEPMLVTHTGSQPTNC